MLLRLLILMSALFSALFSFHSYAGYYYQLYSGGASLVLGPSFCSNTYMDINYFGYTWKGVQGSIVYDRDDSGYIFGIYNKGSNTCTTDNTPEDGSIPSDDPFCQSLPDIRLCEPPPPETPFDPDSPYCSSGHEQEPVCTGEWPPSNENPPDNGTCGAGLGHTDCCTAYAYNSCAASGGYVEFANYGVLGGESCDFGCATNNSADPVTPPDFSGAVGDGSGGNAANSEVSGPQEPDNPIDNTSTTNDTNQLLSAIDNTNNRLDYTNDALDALLESNNLQNDLISEQTQVINNVGQAVNDNASNTKSAIENQTFELKKALKGGDNTGIERRLDLITGILETGSIAGGAQFGDAVSDYLPSATQVATDLEDAANESLASQEMIDAEEGLKSSVGNLTAYESIPQLFALAPQSCGKVDLLGHDYNFCDKAELVRPLLEWAAAMLVVIFLLKSFNADIKRLRLN